MKIQRNLLKFRSLNRPPLPLPVSKRHHILKSATAAATENNLKLMLGRLRWNGVDEGKIFSNIISSEDSSTELSFPTAADNDIYSPDTEYFCGTTTKYYTPLSPSTFSPMKSPNFPHFNNYIVRGSSRGVVCLDNGTEYDVVFWNPTTNEVKFLPQSYEDRPHPSQIKPYVTLSTCVDTAGFGFDSKSQDYKYLRWVMFYFEREDDCGFWHLDDMAIHAEIYSLKTDSWELVNSPRGVMAHHTRTANVKDDLYFSYLDLCLPHNEIFRFDLATNEFTSFLFPHTRKEIGSTHGYKLFDFDGMLGVIMYPTKSSSFEFELWVWHGDGDGGWWSKEFDDYVECGGVPLGFSQDSRLMFVLGIDHLLYAYHIRSKDLKNLGIYCNSRECDLFHYVETTVPLHTTSTLSSS